MRYLLDTDHISLLQRNHPQVKARLQTLTDKDYGVSIISFEEQFKGWLTVISNSENDPQKLALAYLRLEEMQQLYNRFPLCKFSDQASAKYFELRKTYRRLGKMDLRIAAIAITQNVILVTRNAQDFGQIVELTIESWA